jgi:hypothetical protein
MRMQVLLRCGLEDLFGDRVWGVVGYSALFLDLPANMVRKSFT